MNGFELNNFIRDFTTPSTLDIEIAKRKILEYLSMQRSVEIVKSEVLSLQAYPPEFNQQIPLPPGIDTLRPDLNDIKRQVIACEALQSLHASGVLLAFGPLVNAGGIYREPEAREIRFQVIGSYGSISPLDVVIAIPSVHYAYRLSTAFREQNFRLASSDMYLFHLDQTLFHSRAKRCLRESIDAFKSGLYLSSSMLVGAASESLWMRLGSLLASKTDVQGTSDGRRLVDMFNKRPQIGEVIDTSWEVMKNHRKPELERILPTKGDRESFKDCADRLRDRRNYAIHDEEADEDEPRFTYIEAGMLLLDSAEYFTNLGRLIQAMG